MKNRLVASWILLVLSIILLVSTIIEIFTDKYLFQYIGFSCSVSSWLQSILGVIVPMVLLVLIISAQRNKKQ
ncbi:hypothetical protein ACQW5G_05475 [Fructilactobacillus sp. Tb1]|uniref:hypothetical protein n=1 Tax=Fructilactobacillus sp. Tb1 TaxID=3422304 RepID=UPI003D2AC559